jgi:hypothetical protein
MRYPREGVNDESAGIQMIDAEAEVLWRNDK